MNDDFQVNQQPNSLPDGAATSAKQDDILNELKKFELNNLIEASSTQIYSGKTKPDGTWLFVSLNSTAGLVMTYATILNNPTVTTYVSALANYLTLTYGRFDEAF
jgi:hypothetical protein